MHCDLTLRLDFVILAVLVAIRDCPSDSISSLSFSARENLLVSGSWNNEVSHASLSYGSFEFLLAVLSFEFQLTFGLRFDVGKFYR